MSIWQLSTWDSKPQREADLKNGHLFFEASGTIHKASDPVSDKDADNGSYYIKGSRYRIGGDCCSALKSRRKPVSSEADA